MLNAGPIETSQFLLDVMAEGGMERGGHGVRTAQKIRLLHTTIRYLILRDPKWRTQEWGIPINPEEEDSFFPAWKVVGHIMGIESALIPENAEDGQRQMDAILRRP